MTAIIVGRKTTVYYQQSSDTDSAGVKVRAVESHSGGGAAVRLDDGKLVTASKGVVVATDGPAAQQLLGKALSANPSKPEAGVGTCCLYFR